MKMKELTCHFISRRGPLPIAMLLAVAVFACSYSLKLSAATFGTSGATITSVDGHDRAGTTTNRPANMSVGMLYFNMTTGRLEVANGATLNNITDVADATATGGAGLSNGAVAGAGGTGTVTTAGGAGGAYAAAAGAGGAKTGTGAAAGGAGGAATFSAGAGGATASAGADAGGAGGAVTITAGTGGAATAGTGNGGAGGSINLTPGAGGASAGGTAGVAGSISLAGPVSSPVTAAQTIANGNTISLPTTGKNKLLNNAGAVTGIILAAGLFDGQEICLINATANSVTFAASGTSRVADGTSAVIAANTSMRLTYSTTNSLWYHGN